MATAVESLGTLHTNYGDYAIASLGIPTNFEDCLAWNLMHLENANYEDNDQTNDHIHAVRADNGEYTLTTGYGLDIDRYGTWDRVRSLFVYGLTGTNDDTNLTQDINGGKGNDTYIIEVPNELAHDKVIFKDKDYETDNIDNLTLKFNNAINRNNIIRI